MSNVGDLEAAHGEGYGRGPLNRHNPYRPTRHGEAIAAAKDAFASLPEDRRAELNARFDLATMQARAHAAYVRRA